jgi:hypothetical protein
VHADRVKRTKTRGAKKMGGVEKVLRCFTLHSDAVIGYLVDGFLEKLSCSVVSYWDGSYCKKNVNKVFLKSVPPPAGCKCN